MNETQRSAAERLADAVMHPEAAALPRELAAEPVQEPVGWLHDETGDFEPSHKPWMDDDEEWVPLYAAPQQRTPLSDEVVAKLINDEWATPDVPSAWKFARAIERAITGETT